MAPEPVAIPPWLSVPVEVTRYVPFPCAMSSQTGTARTTAFPALKFTVTSSAFVGNVSRLAFTLTFLGAAFSSQHCGQNAHAEASRAVYGATGADVHPGVPGLSNSLRCVRNASSPI